MTTPDLDRDVAAATDNKGAPSDLGFEFSRDGEGCNTRIDYKLVDHMAGHTVKSSVVLDGRITDDDVRDLADSLDPGGILDVSKAGIPDLAEKMPSSWIDSGRSVHVLTRVSYTSNPAPKYLPTADQFLAAHVSYPIDY